MSTINKLKRNFNKFYHALPIRGPFKVYDKSLEKIYTHVYTGNLHHLTFPMNLFVRLLNQPVWMYKGFKTIRKLLQTNGKRVQAEYNISKWTQFKKLANIAFVKNASPNYYYSLGLFKNPELVLTKDYLINNHFFPVHSRLLTRYSPSRKILNNKILFFKTVSEHTAHALDVVAVVNPKRIAFTKKYQEIPECDLFFKPIEGNSGRSCFTIKYSEQTYMVAKKHFSLNKKELGVALQKMSRREAFILQLRYFNHDSIADLSSGALITSRVTTYIDKEGTCQFLFACLMMPTGGIDVSNGIRGGVLSGIDMDTGLIKEAYHVTDKYTAIHQHPDTGKQITGTTLPMWEEAKKICVELHQLFSDIPSIGWDICYTRNGPKVIEGNLNWPIEIWELTDKDFSPEPYIEAMNWHLDNYFKKS